MRPRASLWRILVYIPLVLSITFAVLPFLWMVGYSISSGDAGNGLRLTFSHYERAFAVTSLGRYLVNGVIVCSSIVILQMLVCSPCGYALAKMRLPGRNLLVAGTIAALIVPQHVLALPVFWAIAKLDLLNTYAALVLPFMVSPLGVLLFMEYFRRVPTELIHAGRMDGLGEAEIILRIMLPGAAPAAAAFAIFSIVSHWNDLFWPLIVIQSDSLMPPALGILAFSNDEAGTEYGPMMAAATMIVAPLLVLFLLTQRLVIRVIGRGASQ